MGPDLQPTVFLVTAIAEILHIVIVAVMTVIWLSVDEPPLAMYTAGVALRNSMILPTNLNPCRVLCELK